MKNVAQEDCLFSGEKILTVVLSSLIPLTSTQDSLSYALVESDPVIHHYESVPGYKSVLTIAGHIRKNITAKDYINNFRTIFPGVDCILVRYPLYEQVPLLAVTDVDSTLILQEVIEEIASFAGVRDEVTRITTQAMNGEIDFEQSLRKRVHALRGIPVTVFSDVLAKITPTLGASTLINTIHRNNGYFGVVSGGFEEVVAPLCEKLNIDHYCANKLGVSNGNLTGEVIGRIVTSDIKAKSLKSWARLHQIPLQRVIAFGDGANDIPMLRTAGLGIAFCAKQKVKDSIISSISVPRLDSLTRILPFT